MPQKKPRSLHAAVHAGDLATVLELIEQGKDLYKLDSGDGLTPLARAVNEQHTAIVRALLDAGASPDRGGVEVPLASAASLGNLELVEMLLRVGADPNRLGEDEYVPLMAANSRAVAERLIQAGARVDAVDEDGNNIVLSHVAYCGRDDVFQAIAAHLSPTVVAVHAPFLEEGIRRRLRREDTRGNPLVLAAQAGKLDVVQTMVADGVHVDTPMSVNEDTALLRAVQFHNDDVVVWLLAAGANPSLANDQNETPLSVAIYRGSVEMVSRLIHAGADVHVRNDFGKTLLEQAAYYRRKDLIDLLIDAGVDTGGRTAVEWHREAGQS